MAEYINAIKLNPIAYAVKAADRLHNLQCAIITDEEFKRKYILETVDSLYSLVTFIVSNEFLFIKPDEISSPFSISLNTDSPVIFLSINASLF